MYINFNRITVVSLDGNRLRSLTDTKGAQTIKTVQATVYRLLKFYTVCVSICVTSFFVRQMLISLRIQT